MKPFAVSSASLCTAHPDAINPSDSAPAGEGSCSLPNFSSIHGEELEAQPVSLFSAVGLSPNKVLKQSKAAALCTYGVK